MHWLPEIDGIQYLADLGLPDPNKGEGGKYLIVPDRYEGEIDNAFARLLLLQSDPLGQCRDSTNHAPATIAPSAKDTKGTSSADIPGK
jgi:hypothetical protein